MAKMPWEEFQTSAVAEPGRGPWSDFAPPPAPATASPSPRPVPDVARGAYQPPAPAAPAPPAPPAPGGIAENGMMEGFKGIPGLGGPQDLLRAPVQVAQNIIHGGAETVAKATQIRDRVLDEHPFLAHHLAMAGGPMTFLAGAGVGGFSKTVRQKEQQVAADVIQGNKAAREAEDAYLKQKLNISKSTVIGQTADFAGDVGTGVAKAVALGPAAIPTFSLEGAIQKASVALDEGKPLGKALAAGGISGVTSAALMGLAGGSAGAADKTYTSLLRMATRKAVAGTGMGVAFGAADLAIDRWILGNKITPEQAGGALLQSVKTMLGYELAGAIPQGRLILQGRSAAGEFASPADARANIVPELAKAYDRYAKGDKGAERDINRLYTRMQAVAYAEKAGIPFKGKATAGERAQDVMGAMSVAEAAKPEEVQDAVQKQGASGLLQYPQEGIGEAGGGRGRVEPVVQGEETPSPRQEEKVSQEVTRGADRRQENVPVNIDRRGAERRAQIRDAAAAEVPAETLTHEQAIERVKSLERDRLLDQRIPDMANELAFNRQYQEGQPSASLDVKGLKAANKHGQEMGTEFLVHIGQRLNEAAKQSGLLAAHISGDEFRLTGGSQDEINRVIEQVNDDLAREPFHATDASGKTVSLIGELHAGLGDTPEAADREMAAAKVRRAALDPTPKGEVPAPLRDIPGLKVAGDVFTIPIEELHADPARFQHKVQNETTGINQIDPRTGASGSLFGVKTWNDQSAGVLDVWRDPADRKVYVVNGHNRYAKALELGRKDLRINFLDAPDAKSAMIMGARKNLAEGNGTALDAATYFRGTKSTPADLEAQGIPANKKIVQDGMALASLPDTWFKAAANDPEVMRLAIETGKAGLKGKQADTAFQEMHALMAKRGGDASEISTSYWKDLVDRIKGTRDLATGQTNLFGEEETTSTLPEQTDLIRHIQSKLGAEKQAGTVLTGKRYSEAVGKAAQVNQEGAGALKQESSRALDYFKQQKNLAGIGDIINDYAARLQQAGSAKEADTIRGEALDAVMGEVRSALAGGRPAGDAGSAPVPGAGAEGAGRSETGGLGLEEPAPVISDYGYPKDLIDAASTAHTMTPERLDKAINDLTEHAKRQVETLDSIDELTRKKLRDALAEERYGAYERLAQKLVEGGKLSLHDDDILSLVGMKGDPLLLEDAVKLRREMDANWATDADSKELRRTIGAHVFAHASSLVGSDPSANYAIASALQEYIKRGGSLDSLKTDLIGQAVGRGLDPEQATAMLEKFTENMAKAGMNISPEDQPTLAEKPPEPPKKSFPKKPSAKFEPSPDYIEGVSLWKGSAAPEPAPAKKVFPKKGKAEGKAEPKPREKRDAAIREVVPGDTPEAKAARHELYKSLPAETTPEDAVAAALTNLAKAKDATQGPEAGAVKIPDGADIGKTIGKVWDNIGQGVKGLLPAMKRPQWGRALANLARSLDEKGMLQRPFQKGKPAPPISNSMVTGEKPILKEDMSAGAFQRHFGSPSFMGEGPREFTIDRMLAANHETIMTKTYSDAVRDIYKRHAIPDHSEKIDRVMGKHQETIYGLTRRLQPLVKERNQIQRALDSDSTGDAQGLLEAQLKEFDLEHQADMERMTQERDQAYKDAQDSIRKLAEESPDTRVALWMEPEDAFMGKGIKRPSWLKDLMKPNEIKAAEELRNMNRNFRDAAKGVGIRVMNEDYISHLFRPQDAYVMQQTPEGEADVNAILDFHSRQQPINLMPSVHASMAYYIPAISRKLARQPVLNKWYRDSNGTAGVNDYLDPNSPFHAQNFGQWLESEITDWQHPKHADMVERAVSFAKQLQMTKVLALNQRVGLKHAVTKLANNLAIHRTYMLPSMADYVVKLARAPENLPFVGAAFKNTTGKVLDWAHMSQKDTQLVQMLTTNLIQRRQIMGALTEDPMLASYHREVFNSLFGRSVRGAANAAFKAGRKARNLLGTPVSQIEAMENFVNMAASIHRGESKGLTPEEQIRGAAFNILRISQRGGFDASKFLRSTSGNLLTAFSQTPTKMSEFLADSFRRAAKGERDIYGTHGTSDLLTLMAVYGAMGYAGKKYKLWHMLIHAPMLNAEELSPSARYVYHSAMGTVSAKHKKQALDALAELGGSPEGAGMNLLSMAPTGDLLKDLWTLAVNPKAYAKSIPAVKQIRAEMGVVPRGYPDAMHYLAGAKDEKAERDMKAFKIRKGYQQMRKTHRAAER